MTKNDLTAHLQTLPGELSAAVDTTYRAMMNHYLLAEWDDTQVDAGRFCEAILRFLEWKMSGSYTPIDGKSKPNRKATLAKATNDTALAPSLRAQVVASIDLIMDFRNNRNSAHLGNIDANRMDANSVVQNATWVVGELIRLETNQPASAVQRLLDQLSERHIPLVQIVNDRPVLLNTKLEASDKALVLLYQWTEPIEIETLREWVGYGNPSRWRKVVLPKLQKEARIHVESGLVNLLIPGEARASGVILASDGR